MESKWDQQILMMINQFSTSDPASSSFLLSRKTCPRINWIEYFFFTFPPLFLRKPTKTNPDNIKERRISFCSLLKRVFFLFNLVLTQFSFFDLFFAWKTSEKKNFFIFFLGISCHYELKHLLISIQSLNQVQICTNTLFSKQKFEVVVFRVSTSTLNYLHKQFRPLLKSLELETITQKVLNDSSHPSIQKENFFFEIGSVSNRFMLNQR